eukprot:g10222.t1
MARPLPKLSLHPQTSYFVNVFFFYAFGNTPPTDLLQHVPHDAPRADVLILGCGDLRDLLYSILLHGSRSRTVSFVLNDYEPAVHARNLILLQLFLDSRSLLESSCSAEEVDGIAAGVGAVYVQGGDRKGVRPPLKQKKPVHGDVDASGAAFAQRIGAIFCAMYNVFVDEDVASMIQDVAGRLAASAAVPPEWAATELGRLVRFTDDRSRDRVRKILSSYTDGSLQEPGVLSRVKRERSSLFAAYLPAGGESFRVVSRAMGLSSFLLPETTHAYNDMVHRYLREGILDPFSLLRGGGPAPKRERGSRAKLVNPLLLVTERKGLEYSLHYGAFPLDAFNTDVSLWKLRPQRLQDEYGKLAPRVTKHEEINSCMTQGDGPSATPVAPSVARDAFLGVALEELAQMCGAFLGATTHRPANDAATSTGGTRLTIDVHVGDALGFCDALSAVPQGETGGAPTPIPPVAFQKATVQPLELKGDVFGPAGRPPAFDVIKTSNLADHLGIVNLVMASGPLLKEHSQALLLTSYLSTTQKKYLPKERREMLEELLCMNAHTASVLLGVVPVSSISPVVGHADVLISLAEKLSGSSSFSQESSPPAQLRLAWKRPTQSAAATTRTMTRGGPTGYLVDISPDDFARLVLPVYKAMFEHIPSSEMMAPVLSKRSIGHQRALLRSMITVNHYTSVTFGRLLVLAGRKLRLDEAHFEAALRAVVHSSGLILAPNLNLEQVAVFHTLGLVSIIRPSPGMSSRVSGTRRVVLLVPKADLLKLRTFKQSELYLALSGKTLPFDNHFVSVHAAFVRVRRGKNHLRQDGHDGWRSLSDNLMVRDTREGDPEAELMASALVPAFGLTLAPPASTELQLRLRDSLETARAPADTLKMLGGQFMKRVYSAHLADVDRTAVITPGRPDDSTCSGTPVACPRLACPEAPASGLIMVRESRPSSGSQPAAQRGSGRAPVTHRFMHGVVAVDQSVELISHADDNCKGLRRLLYRATLTMGSTEARRRFAAWGAPVIEESWDPCAVRVKIGKEMSHVTSFPFPVRRGSIELKYSITRGFVVFTVPPVSSVEMQLPFFAWGPRDDVEGVGQGLPFTTAWPMCPPLTALPRLDFEAEWAHSFHPWVCISENRRDDEPAVWVWVNEILLDSSNEALVLDCCVMPVRKMAGAVSARLGAAVELDSLTRGDGTGIILPKAHPGEMALWESLLPVAVERARQSYTHTAECAYTRPRESRRSVLCTCGEGKDLPSAFEKSMKQIHPPGMGSAHPLFHRAALSPLLAPAEGLSAAQSLEMTASAVAGCGKCGKRESDNLGKKKKKKKIADRQ